jgi:hypothetical protein
MSLVCRNNITPNLSCPPEPSGGIARIINAANEKRQAAAWAGGSGQSLAALLLTFALTMSDAEFALRFGRRASLRVAVKWGSFAMPPSIDFLCS